MADYGIAHVLGNRVIRSVCGDARGKLNINDVAIRSKFNFHAFNAHLIRLPCKSLYVSSSLLHRAGRAAGSNDMQSEEVSPEEPPLVEIEIKGQTFETYVVSTEAVAEAAYLIREVLIDDCYLRHGLQITPGATVVDIGANIGLFGVMVLSAVPGGDVTYIGVEPVPANFAALQYNLIGSTGSTAGTGSTASAAAGACSASGTAAEQSFFHFNAAYAAAVAAPAAGRISRPYPGNIQLIRKAVSNAPGSLPMTFYPRMPGNSTLRPGEKAALQQHLMPDFFSAVEHFEVPVITLRQLLQEAVPAGSRIEFLKIDVEGEELSVLQGLDEAGWQRVQQVVVEVHDCMPGGLEAQPAESAAAAAATTSTGAGPTAHAAPEPQQPPGSRPADPTSITPATAAAQAAGRATADDVLASTPAFPATQCSTDWHAVTVGGCCISFVRSQLPTGRRDASGVPLLQAAPPPRQHGRVMAVARLLQGLGFRVVVECVMLGEAVPGNYIVYARRG